MHDIFRSNIWFSGILFLFLCWTFASAHGVGLTLESITPEGYKTYLDANTPMPYQNEPIRLDFEIWTSEGKSMEFTDLWVRIENELQTVFAGPIQHAQLGKTGFTTTLPYVGNYTISARFQNGDTVLAETSFTLSAEADENTARQGGIRRQIFTGMAGVLLGGVLMYIVCGKRKPDPKLS